ncbi:MAG: hypothetical protein AVDCRST_MAG37-631, partial [uncultured Rubrobacteraceae bacterium]
AAHRVSGTDALSAGYPMRFLQRQRSALGAGDIAVGPPEALHL